MLSDRGGDGCGAGGWHAEMAQRRRGMAKGAGRRCHPGLALGPPVCLLPCCPSGSPAVGLTPADHGGTYVWPYTHTCPHLPTYSRLTCLSLPLCLPPHPTFCRLLPAAHRVAPLPVRGPPGSRQGYPLAACLPPRALLSMGHTSARCRGWAAQHSSGRGSHCEEGQHWCYSW